MVIYTADLDVHLFLSVHYVPFQLISASADNIELFPARCRLLLYDVSFLFGFDYLLFCCCQLLCKSLDHFVLRLRPLVKKLFEGNQIVVVHLRYLFR